MEHARACWDSGEYLILSHALERQEERSIIDPEIEYVLKNGWHEKSKDQYKEMYRTWCYAVRGKTIDARELRIVLSFDEENMLIITVIDLKRLQ